MNGKTISINRSWWNSITPASTRKYKHQYVHFRSELSILIEQENVRHKDRIEYSFQNSTRTTLNLLGNIYHGFVQWFPCGEEISGTAGEAANLGNHGPDDGGGRRCRRSCRRRRSCGRRRTSAAAASIRRAVAELGDPFPPAGHGVGRADEESRR